MKLAIVITLFTALQAHAGAFGQNVRMQVQQTEVRKILTSIEKSANVRFLYNYDLAPVIKTKVDFTANNIPLRSALDNLLQKVNLSYKVLENNLVVLLKEADEKNAYDQRVSGKVTNESGQPFANVSVKVKGTNSGTITNSEGVYNIPISGKNAVLVFSFVGYEDKEITVGEQTTINTSLVPSQKELDQVIVVGYGTQKKIDVTGSVAAVKGEDIAKQASTNPISALQGKVAGVQITNSGAPGSSPQVRIRGLGTVYGNANPLYVVDGVWYDDISFLNPADIDNISVLKDASSESIYGVRAANGVILVTTKKGKSGQAIVNYSGSIGFQHVTNSIKMANANEFATMVNELAAANGSAALLDPTQFGVGTDWYHQVLRNALITNHQVSVSGGSEKSTYNFSLGYLKQEGLVKGNDYTRVTARLQNDFQVFKNLKLGYTATAASNNFVDFPGDIFHQLFAAAPVVPVYYKDGSYGDPSDYNLGDGANFNPQATLDFFNQKTKNYRVSGSAYGDLKLMPHLTFHSSIGGDFGQIERRNYQPVYTATLKQRNTASQLTMIRTESRNWILENTLTYENKFNNHNLKVLLGQSAQRYQSYGWNATAPNVPNTSEGDYYLRLGSTAGRNVDDNGSVATIASYFGRVTYDYQGKYLLNFSMRADGSSKFFGDNRWGYFPSVGAGWVITRESFMQNQKLFNNLKLRASWGKIGNVSVPSNISVLTVTQAPYLTAIFGNQPYTGASINSVVPPTTYWERGVGTDIGLDASLLSNKLTVELDYYNKKTEKAIFDIPILSSVGTSSGTILGNQADFQNRGVELAITWKNEIGKDITYSVSANLGVNDNKVLSVTTGSNPIYGGGGAATGGQLSTRTMVGQPIGQFYGLVVAGVFQNQSQITGSAQPNAKPGDFIYVDQDKNGVIDARDRVPLGNPNPRYSYGVNTNWTYKQFDLTLDFQGVAGVQVYNANLGLRYGNENFTKDFYDKRWHGEGTSNSYPSANIGGGDNYRPNSFFVEDGSYFRVRNMQLGYTLPASLTDRWKVKKLRVYLNAQNAFNFFKYRGFTPEIGGSAINQGIDTNVYPLYATYNFGVNLTF